jgi:hypothetical protein
MVICKYCDKSVKNILYHEGGIKHLQLTKLYSYLEGSYGLERDKIIREIETIKRGKGRSYQSEKWKEYRKQYYLTVVKPTKKSSKLPSEFEMTERHEIAHANGTIEINETWRERKNNKNQ